MRVEMPLSKERRASMVQFSKCWQLHLFGAIMALAVLLVTLGVLLSLTAVIAVIGFVVHGCAICCNTVGITGVVRHFVAALSLAAFVHWAISAASLVFETDLTRMLFRRCIRLLHSATSRILAVVRVLTRRGDESSSASALSSSPSEQEICKMSPCVSVANDLDALLHNSIEHTATYPAG